MNSISALLVVVSVVLLSTLDMKEDETGRLDKEEWLEPLLVTSDSLISVDYHPYNTSDTSIWIKKPSITNN